MYATVQECQKRSWTSRRLFCQPIKDSLREPPAFQDKPRLLWPLHVGTLTTQESRSKPTAIQMNATRPLMFWIVTLALVAIMVVLLRQVLLPFVAGMALAYLA